MNMKGVINGSYIITIILLSLSLLSDTTFLPLFIIGKCFFGLIFTSLYIYTAELFPTHIRSKAYGFCSFVARIGGILMPFFFYNVIEFGVRPTVLFILFLSLLFGSLSLLLPDSQKS
jgi:OCT family organic cation transporter-like MFS transporter 4/5